MDEVYDTGDVRGLLASAREAGPAHRIEWRDRIAAHGQSAIEAIAPWLAEPKLAAFAIRVIERAGHEGEREAATHLLRAARREIDPLVRPDLDWALLHLRVPARSKAPATPRDVRPARVARAEKPLGAGRGIRASH